MTCGQYKKFVNGYYKFHICLGVFVYTLPHSSHNCNFTHKREVQPFSLQPLPFPMKIILAQLILFQLSKNSLFILTAQLYILSDFLIGADDCFCEANNNTYSPVSSDNCENFVQQPNNGKHNCPMGLRFDTRMCVCNHAAIVHCPATCGPQG